MTGLWPTSTARLHGALTLPGGNKTQEGLPSRRSLPCAVGYPRPRHDKRCGAVTVSPRRLRFQGAGCYTSNRLPRPWQTYDASPRTPHPAGASRGEASTSLVMCDAIANAALMTVP